MKLFHYTSLYSLLGILKPNRKLEFWGSRFDCMNDPLDFQFSKNRILPYARKASIDIDMAGDNIKKVSVEPYIVSFSKGEDDFLMWRMYKAKVCLCLDIKAEDYKYNNCMLNDCSYVEDTDKDIIDAIKEISKTIKTCGNVDVEISRISTFIKHASFSPEKEVRLATWDYFDENGNKLNVPDASDTGDITTKSFFTRTNADNHIVLYKKFKIDGNALKKIIIHTYSQLEFKELREKIKAVIIQNGFSFELAKNGIVCTQSYPFDI